MLARNDPWFVTHGQRLATCLTLTAALGLAPQLGIAQTVGQIETSRGITTVQTVKGDSQIAGQGTRLAEGDRIVTGNNTIAEVKLTDGTRMTVRPNSNIVLTSVKYNAEQPDSGNLVLSLFKGGLRAITGLISKNTNNTAQIRTATATIGIRGTDFDARLCESDCQIEASAARASKTAEIGTKLLAAGRIVSLRGALSATNANGNSRGLQDGGPVYPGDTLVTGAGGYAVIAFRDESRITLAPNSQFKLGDFVYESKQPQEGRFFANLLRGGMRVLTGLVGKAKPDNVSFRTATATIGIRGTQFDVLADDLGTRVQTEVGAVFVEFEGRRVEVGTGQCLLNASITTCQVLFNGIPRPGDLPVDFLRLFGGTALEDGTPGLYVVVRDGHIRIGDGDRFIDLGAGEIGFSDGKIFIRPTFAPDLFNPPVLQGNLGNMMRTAGVSTGQVCK
jgi:hypothetical protein